MNFISLKNLGLLRISGVDAQEFLQGQLTNDITLLKDNWHYSGYCNPKGRLLGLFAIWRHDDNFYALISNSIATAVQARLKMFVMRSQVAIEILNAASVVGVFGKTNTVSLADDESIALPISTRGNLIRENDCFSLAFDRRHLVVDPSGDKIVTSLTDEAEHIWLEHNIDAGLPSLQAETVEMFVPQMLNLDLLNGISFKKGCYTGQEIVARMHYLGKLKQRMFLCDVLGDGASPAPGAKIITSDGKNAGNLVTPVINNKCLAVLRLELSQSSLVFEESATGKSDKQTSPALTVAKKQPYPLQTD